MRLEVGYPRRLAGATGTIIALGAGTVSNHAPHHDIHRRRRVPLEAGRRPDRRLGSGAREVLAPGHGAARDPPRARGSHRRRACGRRRPRADDGNVSGRGAFLGERLRDAGAGARDLSIDRPREQELIVSILVRVAFSLVCAAAIASCTLGPNYKRPAVETRAVHRGASSSPLTTDSLADLKWFDLFKDDQLTEFVNTALKQNFDLRIAAERVLQARAAYGITRSGQFPEVTASADLVAARASKVGATQGIPDDADTSVRYLQAGFGLGWEIDVWGRLRRLNEAARARYLATEEARHGVITTLIADVTDNYLALRALDLEL